MKEKLITRFALLLLVGATILLAGPLGAQNKDDLKRERKEWKKRLKATDPLELKKLLADRDSLNKEVVAKNDLLITSEARIKQLTEDNDKMKSNLEVATAPAPNTEDASKLSFQKQHHSVDAGVVFKVQVGAFRNRNLAKYLDNNPNFSGDTDADGSRKYTLGYFDGYWEADNFKKYLREMGVKDAWVVSYRDGKRVPIKEVIEGTVGMN